MLSNGDQDQPLTLNMSIQKHFLSYESHKGKIRTENVNVPFEAPRTALVKMI